MAVDQPKRDDLASLMRRKAERNARAADYMKKKCKCGAAKCDCPKCQAKAKGLM